MISKKALLMVLLTLGTAVMGQSTKTKKVEMGIDCAIAIHLALGDMAKSPPYSTNVPYLPEDDKGLGNLLKREVGSVECSIMNNEVDVRFVSAANVRDGDMTYVIDHAKMEIKQRALPR